MAFGRACKSNIIAILLGIGSVWTSWFSWWHSSLEDTKIIFHGYWCDSVGLVSPCVNVSQKSVWAHSAASDKWTPEVIKQGQLATRCPFLRTCHAHCLSYDLWGLIFLLNQDLLKEFAACSLLVLGERGRVRTFWNLRLEYKLLLSKFPHYVMWFNLLVLVSWGVNY